MSRTRATSAILQITAFALALAPTAFADVPGSRRPDAATAMQWSQGDPTPQEQDAMEHINRLRANPIGELSRILGLAPQSASIAAILLPYQNRLPNGSLETLAQTAARLIADVSQDLASRQGILPMSTAPLAFYPLFQQRAGYQRENFYSFELAGQIANPAAIFNPVYNGAEKPPAYLFSPVVLDSNTFSDLPLSSFTGPNATGGTATFGPYGNNGTMITWTDLSVEGGIDFDQWAAFLMLGENYPALLAQGPYLPNLSMGHGRLAGVDFSPRTGSPGTGDNILTVDISDAQFLTAGDDLPYGPTGTVFITGVVYHDTNGNGIYDAGEGIGGAIVTIAGGSYYAVSSASGGYAIPVPANSGKWTVTAAAGAATLSGNATVAGDSVKLDFAMAAPLPAPTGATRLINISSRAFVGTGDSVLVAGFFIAGSGTEQVLVRGIGPALAAFGVSGTLASPQLTVFDSGGNVLAANAGWSTGPLASQIAETAAAVGAFPLPSGGADCAALLDLPPGGYTAQVSGIGGATGNGMVEVYEVPPPQGG
jgi:hypothetical protein